MKPSREVVVVKNLSLISVLVLAVAIAAAAHGASANRVVIKTAPGLAPLHIAIGDGAVWVGTHRGAVLYRVNPRTNRKNTILVGQGTCGFPAFGAGFVFQSGCDDTQTSLQINPRTNKVTRHIPGLYGAFGAGSLWVVDANAKIERVDARSGVRLATIDPGLDLTQDGGPVGVLDGSLWVADDTAVSRIDVQTNKLTQVIALPGAKIAGDLSGGYLNAAYGTFLNGKVWVTNPAGLFEVDPAAGSATLFPVHIAPMSQFGDLYVAAGKGSLWMRTGDTSVARINPATGNVIQRYPAAGGGGGVAVGYGSLWIVNAGADSIWRYSIQ